MRFSVHIPGPPLNAYVAMFYYPQGSIAYRRERVLPMPTADLKINFGDALRAHRPDCAGPFAVCTDAWCSGPFDQHHVVEWGNLNDFIGVSFKPGGAYRFFGLPISELHNQIVPLENFGKAFVSELRERLFEAPTLSSRFQLLEELLRKRPVNQAKGEALSSVALRRAASGAVLSTRELSDSMGVSQKHLIEVFKRFVGATPKEVLRLQRFQGVIDRVDLTRAVSWTQIAHDNGFFDQSHFNREFLAFTGVTPSHYLRLRRQLAAEAPGHLSSTRLLPV